MTAATSPAGPLHAYLAADHQRIDAALRAALAGARVDVARYQPFRGALLRHIGVEEKILLPAARGRDGGPDAALTRQLRADHAALAALLVPTPTPALVAQIELLLAAHDALEERRDGLYARCEQLAGAGAEALLERMRAAPPVPLAPHFDGPRAFAAIERLLRAAGRHA